ncbi:LOW QUALITY PROTEIN: hypothetical protein YC2023_012431 [Brassica napus]
MFCAPNPEESENPHKNWKLSTNNPSLRLYVRREIDHKNPQTQTRPSTSPLNPRHSSTYTALIQELVRNAHVSVTPGLLSQLVKALGRGKMVGKFFVLTSERTQVQTYFDYLQRDGNVEMYLLPLLFRTTLLSKLCLSRKHRSQKRFAKEMNNTNYTFTF